MAQWKNQLQAVPIPKARELKRPKATAPKLNKIPNANPVAATVPRPVVSPATPTGRGGWSSPAWYSPKAMAARDESLSSALVDPLAPTTGDDALTFAKSLVQSQVAPVMQEYDRQQGLAQSRYTNQAARQSAGTDQLRAAIAAQLAGQQQSQAKARDHIAGVGQQLQQNVDQGAARADATAVQDAAVRGAGLDGGSAAQRAQEAANARARGQAGTQVASDTQAGAAASGDALLNQIMAATA